MLVTCPSGLEVRVRALRGSEIDMLGNRQAARKGELFDRILTACTAELVSPGPYNFKMGVVDWPSVLVCDRFYTLVAIRVATYGGEYAAAIQCASPMCKANFEWDLDVRELPVFDLPEETVAKIASGDNRFSVTVDDHEYGFRLLTGRDEVLMSRRVKNNPDSIMTTAVASRITSIDGDDLGVAKIESALRDADAGLLPKLLEAFEAVDGGIESSIEVVCPSCSSQFEVQLPFEAEGFWIRPVRKQKPRAARKARTMMQS